jgi:hypothetical protein
MQYLDEERDCFMPQKERCRCYGRRHARYHDFRPIKYNSDMIGGTDTDPLE